MICSTIAPVPATGFNQIESGSRQQDHRGGGFAAVYRGIANALIEFLFGLGAQNGFVGRADGAEHPVQPPHRALAALARGLMVEIVERKRNVCRHALQHRDDLPVDRVAPRAA